MDKQKIFTLFYQLTELSSEQAEQYRHIITLAMEQLSNLLKQKPQGQVEIELAEHACASMCFYQYCLLLSCKTPEQIQMQNLTVRNDITKLVANARQLREEAISAIRHLCKDNCFYFGGIVG